MVVLAVLFHWRRVIEGWRQSAQAQLWRRFTSDVERHPGDVTSVRMTYSLSVNPPQTDGSGTALRLKDWRVL